VQHLLDVLTVLGAESDQARLVAQIVVAVGQSQAALREPEGILRGALGIRPHEVGERRGNADALKMAHQRTDVAGMPDAFCELQFSVQRPDSEPLNSRLVHVARVQVADFARFGIGGSLRRLDQIALLKQRLFGHHGINAIGGTIRRDRHVPQPPAIGVPEKIVLRKHRLVDIGGLNAGDQRGIRAGHRYADQKRRRCESEEWHFHSELRLDRLSGYGIDSSMAQAVECAKPESEKDARCFKQPIFADCWCAPL